MPMPKCQLEGGSPGYIFQLAGLVQTQVTCNAPPLGREGSQRVRIGYPVGMRRRLTGPSQIVVLALIAVLLQTVLISPNCLAARSTPGPASASVRIFRTVRPAMRAAVRFVFVVTARLSFVPRT